MVYDRDDEIRMPDKWKEKERVTIQYLIFKTGI